MFNFKRVKQVVKQSFEPTKDTQVIIAEIHESFDTASEKLLNDAKAILSGSYDIDKGKRLKEIGFVSAKKAVEATEIITQKEKNEYLAKQIEYYQLHYPNNKFITEGKVKEICQKYGLLCGEVKYYISDVPEKNLAEIESFKLREDDYLKITNFNQPYESGIIWGHHERGNWGWSFVQRPTEEKYHITLPAFTICASVKDFDTKNMRIEDGYKLELNLPDPIVLQPVKDGYLIVSKWGLEAEDKDLINEKQN